MNKVVGTVNELIKAGNIKHERQQQLMARLEQSHNGLAVETGQKLSQLSNKVNERKAFGSKSPRDGRSS